MFDINRKLFWCCGMVILLVVTTEALLAGESRDATTITVKNMCQGCANKISAKLKGTPGVAAVATDLRTRTVTITPQARAQLSPKLLWEAVEAGGEQPVKLQGPAGTFTAKPQR